MFEPKRFGETHRFAVGPRVYFAEYSVEGWNIRARGYFGPIIAMTVGHGAKDLRNAITDIDEREELDPCL